MPGDLPDLGIEPTYHFMSPALAGRFFTTNHGENQKYTEASLNWPNLGQLEYQNKW